MSKPDAIKNDVSQEEQREIVEAARDSVNSDRLETVADLAQAHRAARDADIAEDGGEVIDTSGKEADDPIEDDPKENTDELAAQEADEPKEETRTLKVNGQDVEVPLSQIIESGIRTHQKESSADQRLAEATRLLNEVKEREANPSSQDVGSSKQDSAPSKQDAEKLAKTLIDGDIEEVTNAVETLLKGRGNSQEIATQVQQMDNSQIHGFVQNALGIEKAMTKFKDAPENGGFSDLHNDETLQKMVMDKEAALCEADGQAGIVRTPTERLVEAATEVRNWRSGIIKDAGVSVSGFEDRKTKKASTDSTIEGSGGRETSKRDAKPKTRGEVRKSAIEKMAAARGQQTD